jgi:hypothetical protein
MCQKYSYFPLSLANGRGNFIDNFQRLVDLKEKINIKENVDVDVDFLMLMLT